MTSLAGDRSGEVLGDKYQLVRRIGTGGMGAVYEAIQADLGRRVAVKVLHTHLSLEPTLLERFRREALAAAALGHPNIVSVSDLQSPEDEPPFLVMELLTGLSLKQAIQKNGTMEPRRVAHVAAQVLSALGAAHAERIVHRDVKPDNIVLIDTTAMRDFVKVLDFGVAKLQRENVEGLTMAGAILGTLSYMAPEQARGEVLDGRVDVYSVGACMYHALTGRKPFDHKKAKAELYAAVLMEKPPALAELRPDLDARLVAIVSRAMEKRAADRFATAEEMVNALLAWQGAYGAHPSLPPPGSQRSRTLAPVTPTAVAPTSITIPIEVPAAVRGEKPAAVPPPAPSSSSSVSGERPSDRSLQKRKDGTPTSSKRTSSKRSRSRRSLAMVGIVAVSVVAGVVMERLVALLVR